MAATVSVLLAGIAPSMSQEIAASEFNTENVRRDAPFLGLPIDRSRVDRYLADIDAFLARFNEEDLTELQQRCVVITDNDDIYDEASVELCNAVLAAAVAG
jgi:hypothetical protein